MACRYVVQGSPAVRVARLFPLSLLTDPAASLMTLYHCHCSAITLLSAMNAANQRDTARVAKGARKRGLGHSMPSNASKPGSTECFESIAQRYLECQEKRLSRESFNRVRNIIRTNLIPHFGSQRAPTTFAATDISNYLSERAKQVSTASLAKEFTVIRDVFQNALEFQLIKSNPAIETLRPELSYGRQPHKPLTAREVSKILESSPEWLRAVIMIGLLAGLRPSELTSLRWGDWVTGELHVRQVGKLKRYTSERVVRLTESANEILLSIRPPRVDPTQPIFRRPPATAVNISQQFLRASRKAGIEQASFNSLRTTGADWIHKAGMGVEMLSAYLGHVSVSSTFRYLEAPSPSLGDRGLGDAMRLVERSLLDIDPENDSKLN